MGFEYFADKNYSEAAELRATMTGVPTEEQIERQRRAGWEWSGIRIDENNVSHPTWSYEPGAALRMRDAILSIMNPFRPLGDPHRPDPDLL
jgi:hypothetical protein